MFLPWKKFIALQALGLTFGVAFASLPVFAQGLSRAEQPNLSVGDSWVYETRIRGQDKPLRATQVVQEVTPDRVVIRSGNTLNTYTRDLNQTESKTGETVTYTATPERTLYRFPLEIGKKYDAKFGVVFQSGTRKADWSWTAEVVGAERITVPAGTFETLKIQIRGNWQGGDNNDNWTGTRTETLWYAPAVNRHVKSEWEERVNRYYNAQVTELISYKPGKQ